MTLLNPTVTGHSDFWQNPRFGGVDSANYAMAGKVPHQATRRVLGGAFMRSVGNREVRAILYALMGAAVGGNATFTYKRPTANTGDTNKFGQITIETVTGVNRNTTANDLTQLQAAMNDGFFGEAAFTYPVDAAGVGGGGKLGY
jgi:hypothetical protein